MGEGIRTPISARETARGGYIKGKVGRDGGNMCNAEESNVSERPRQARNPLWIATMSAWRPTESTDLTGEGI